MVERDVEHHKLIAEILDPNRDKDNVGWAARQEIIFLRGILCGLEEVIGRHVKRSETLVARLSEVRSIILKIDKALGV